MGGAVSSGQDNDELVDNLKEADYIKSWDVEKVFRIVDRAHYYLAEYKKSAYKDLAWKSGTLHLSAPCIYSEVMEALELKPGMSFLNLGSGTGYLNTMVGFVIGPYGINHGVELHQDNVTYAQEKLESFKKSCHKFDDLELGEPQFVVGNCLNLAPENRLYDRVYCGAGCPMEEKEFIQGLIKIGGILVVPVGDQLLKIRRVGEIEFSSDNVLPVSFASLIPPGQDRGRDPIMLPEVNPLSLQCICRLSVRNAIRSTFSFEQPKEDAPNLVRGSKVKGRILKHVRPTPQGLIVMRSSGNIGAHNAIDDDEESDGDFPQGRLHIQVQELIRWGQSFPGFQPDPDPEDIDSDLSDDDMEEPSSTKDEDKSSSVNGNKNGKGASTSGGDGLQRIPEAMESDDNWETAEEEKEEKMKKLKENNKKEKAVEIVNNDKKEEEDGQLNGNGITGKVECTKEAGVNHKVEKMECENRTKTVSVSSNSPLELLIGEGKSESGQVDEGMQDSFSSDSDSEDNSQVSGAPVPIIHPCIPSVFSQPRTIKTSYSTSADTSETSGFGSLGEELPTLGSQLSTDGSLKDDLSDSITEKSEKEGESCSGDVFASTSPKSSQTLEDGDGVAPESSTDAEWVYMQDDNEEEDDEDSEDSDSDLEVKASTIRKKKQLDFLEDDDSDAEEEEDEEEGRHPRGPDFTAFLKEKVDTLPIPSTLKAFILHYR